MSKSKLFPIEKSDCAPKFDPEKWSALWCRKTNNCFAYACDDPEIFRPAPVRPGGAAGVPKSACISNGTMMWNVQQMLWAAERDGLQRAWLPVAKPGYYLIAVAVTDKKMDIPARSLTKDWEKVPNEGWDAHWYQQNDDGTWSQKQGTYAPSKLDESGHVITDPRTCDRGLYRRVVGFFYVRAGGAHVQHHKAYPDVPLPLPQPKFR